MHFTFSSHPGHFFLDNLCGWWWIHGFNSRLYESWVRSGHCSCSLHTISCLMWEYVLETFTGQLVNRPDFLLIFLWCLKFSVLKSWTSQSRCTLTRSFFGIRRRWGTFIWRMQSWCLQVRLFNFNWCASLRGHISDFTSIWVIIAFQQQNTTSQQPSAIRRCYSTPTCHEDRTIVLLRYRGGFFDYWWSDIFPSPPSFFRSAYSLWFLVLSFARWGSSVSNISHFTLCWLCRSMRMRWLATPWKWVLSRFLFLFVD